MYFSLEFFILNLYNKGKKSEISKKEGFALNHPDKLPFQDKRIWYYDDIFPSSRPYSLIRCFKHKNYNMNLHTHDFYEINLITSGEGVHYTLTGSEKTQIGDILIIPPGAYHGYYCIEGLDVYHFLIHKNFFRRYYSDLNMLPAFPMIFSPDHNVNGDEPCIFYFNISNDNYQTFLDLFVEIDNLDYTSSLSNGADTLPMYLTTYAKSIILLANICEEYRKVSSISKNTDALKADSAILAAVDYIHSHYTERITLDDLCAAAFMSKSSLSERFAKHIGQSPLSYVNYYRILVAKKLLIETDKSISEIASEVGFFDYSHFSKVYKKYENIPPANLRTRKGI